MMILVEKTLGNIRDQVWKGANVEDLVLEQWEAPKSRLRKNTPSGIELAISLPRSEHLHDGDVLYHDPATSRIVVARIPLSEVMVIDLDMPALMPQSEMLRLVFEIGHALGNQHWPAVIKKQTIYVPLSVDRKVMSSVMRTHAFQHASIRFEPGEDVAQRLDPSEIRLLFGGADATPHHHHGQADGPAGAQAGGPVSGQVNGQVQGQERILANER
jgi:urease accessory protein